MADYAKKTNAELVEILKSRNLPHTGKKAEMVARLEENDAAAPPAAATENAEDVIDWEDDEVPTTASNTKPAETAPAPAPAAPAAAEPVQEAPKTEEKTEGPEAAATKESTEQQPASEEKPAPNFSIGLSVTDLEEELKKRKARAEKFGITEDSQAAIDAAEKKLERAKRFGTAGEEETNAQSVGRLDKALPERSRKRGRGEGEQGGRGGKRRNQGRNNNQRNRRGNKPQGQGQGQKGNQQKPAGTTSAASNGWSEKDKAAMEARKKRFAA
ncbi:hypothetical protein BDV19DRAFT_383762 [Aspergillus venezuelensis]